MALINCKECGKEISDTAEFCPHCGYKEHHEEHPVDTGETQQQNTVEQPVQPEIQQNVQSVSNIQTQLEIQQPVQNNNGPQMQSQVDSTNKQVDLKNFMKNKPTTASIIIVVIAIVVGLIIAISIFNGVQNSKKAVKVDISMTSYYGHIDDILDELGLDFDLVTAGANCYTGVQKSQFKTEKFGILHTEFRYCKSNKTLVFRVYNDDSDQPLRDPKPGELATFNNYGRIVSSGRNSL